MIFDVLAQPVQEFIKSQTIPATQLALHKNPFPDVDWALIVNQVAARQKALGKLPTWYAADAIIYPSKISIEQTSSETAAAYKASLIFGESLIDLTGGFGVDDYYFAKSFASVTHCELDMDLSGIASHNFKILGSKNIDCIAGDSLEILHSINRQYDCIYIDPSRRNDAKGKVFMLADCLPNVPELLDTYFKYTETVLIKTAPILDITAGLSELKFVKAIHIVAVNNEVKELLWLMKKGFNSSTELIAINLDKEGTSTFTTTFGDEALTHYALPQKYLYEPNSAIMKSGAFDAVCNSYKVAKLHRHSHLYTSDDLKEFAGRRFKIEELMPYHKNTMKALEGNKMNVTVRNFPLTVEEIRKKWKIKEGGNSYCFFTTNMNNEKIIVLCAKI